MRLLALFAAAPFFFEFCAAEKASVPVSVPPPAVVPDEILNSVVRVDMRKQFRGAGIVVDGHHIVASAMALDGYKYIDGRRDVITVDGPRHLARVVAADDIVGLVLLHTKAALPPPITFGPAVTAPQQAVLVGYFEVGARLDTIERIQFSAHINDVDARIETLGEQDALGSYALTSGRNTIGFYRGGASVLAPASGELLGMVFGRHFVDDYSAGGFYAIPAAKIMTFLDKHHVEYRRTSP